MSAAKVGSAPPAWARNDVTVYPDFKHTELLLESRIKNEVQPPIKLDSDEQICKPFLTPGGCPLGASCPKRHTNPSPLNYVPPPVQTSAHSKTVCKHWLRGLCKKGSDCEFLHEYNLRKMPECWFFTKHGFCSSGDECMYLHITPHQRRPECRSYTAGFCRAGPECPFKHIRRVMCPLYLVGFCPEGANCPLAHPPFLLPEIERIAKHEHERERDQYRNRDRDWPGDVGAPGGFGGGRGAYAGDAMDDGPTGGRRPPGRILKGVTCFKCGIEGHLANACPNPSVPGNRGGIERGPGGRPLER